jgi:dolichol-phosphate mannosyltransferase
MANRLKSRSAFIALPTYNEAENIAPLIMEIEKVAAMLAKRRDNPWTIDILVIDDDSPDGTAEIVKKLQKRSHSTQGAAIHLLTGPKKGLGAAYTRGFNHILKHHDPDFIFEMDADFQHDPKDIPRFLQKAEEGWEFVIGSRYIPGGDYPNWSFKRKLYSWGANLVARFIAGIYNIDDCTSGFRCISAKFLRSLELESLHSDGYAFQMSILHAAHKKRIPIVQIPILFPNRAKGRSKLGPKDIGEFFLNAFRLRFKRYRWKR